MKTIILILLLALSAFACPETIEVRGHVVRQTEPNVYMPIAQAKVQNDTYFGYTNAFGYFSFTVPNCGKRQFTATHKSFTFEPQTFNLPVPDALFLNIDFVANQTSRGTFAAAPMETEQVYFEILGE